MKRIHSTMLFGLLLGCGLSAGTAMAADTVDGHTYRVTVRSSFNTEFDDCYSFATGTLKIALYGQPEFYRHDDLNTQPPAWQSTAPHTNAFVLSFHGTTAGFNGQVINGNGLTEFGDTFIIQGVAVASCVPGRGPARSGGSAYKQ